VLSGDPGSSITAFGQIDIEEITTLKIENPAEKAGFGNSWGDYTVALFDSSSHAIFRVFTRSRTSGTAVLIAGDTLRVTH
jgi:hypothetical protein